MRIGHQLRLPFPVSTKESIDFLNDLGEGLETVAQAELLPYKSAPMIVDPRSHQEPPDKQSTEPRHRDTVVSWRRHATPRGANRQIRGAKARAGARWER